MATGALCGWVNGALISRLNIPSLVITIGTSFLYRGIELVLMNGTGVPLTQDKFLVLQAMFNSHLFGVPVETLWAVLFAVICWVLLNRTRFGAHVFLVGDNATSARLMGISDAISVKTRAFMLVGVLVGLRRADDLLRRATTSGRRPATAFLLNTIASVFLGAPRCSAARARSSARWSPPTSSGRSTPASCRPGINAFYTQLCFGLVIVLSVVLQTIIERRVRRQSITG